jgi:alginate O-acetyltransferase complex protein AlgI
VLFPTIRFAVFFGVVLGIGWLLARWPPWWKRFVLVASYVFYAGWDWRFVGLVAASTVVNQVLATRIHRATSRRAARALLIVAVAANLGVLGYFKYYGFFSSSLVNLFHDWGIDLPLPVVQVILPVGISFFTFHALSYVIDVYRGSLAPARLVDFAVYVAFFPHLVAGPIVRASELLPQLRHRLDRTQVDASRAAFLIVAGLFKKVVLASYLSEHIVDGVFANPEQHTAPEVLFAVYAYAIQIYADFSGYTDIAIGCALLMGIRFPDNFDAPYTAASLQDFWRRWHMTLSRWLRDYLYIPLGGSRRGPARTGVNLMLTMLLGGLWHGADWRFVVWGGLHGGGQVVESTVRSGRTRRLARRRERLGLRAGGLADGAAAESESLRRLAVLNKGLPDSMSREAQVTVLSRVETAARRREERRIVRAERGPSGAGRWLGRIATFHFVCLGWIFFRAESLDRAWDMCRRIIDGGWGSAPLVTPLLVIAIAASLVSQYVPVGTMGFVQDRFSRLAPALQGALVGCAFLVIDALGPTGVAPFIYFQF